jgi:hypothetical protein
MSDLTAQIKMNSEAHLTCINHDKLQRQKRRPEDHEVVEDAWDVTFGQHCDKCNHKHARHSPCREGDA